MSGITNFFKLLILFGILIFSSGCFENNHKSDAFGNFEAVEIMVSSEIAGKIVEFNAKEGTLLAKGDTVCRIDDYPLKLKKDELVAQKNVAGSKIIGINAQIKIIEEQKEIIEKDKTRFLKMLEEGAATQKQVDDISGQLKVYNRQIENILTQKITIENELKLIDVKIAQIQDQIDRCAIKNPEEGTMLAKYSEAGEICGAGKPLYKLANLKDIFLRAYISEKQLSSVKLGQEVEIIVDDADLKTKSYAGRITYISDKSEFTPKTIQTRDERVKLVYSIKISTENDGYLKIGMPAEIKLK